MVHVPVASRNPAQQLTLSTFRPLFESYCYSLIISTRGKAT